MNTENIMKNHDRSVYLAIGYLCNENCEFCPCSIENRQVKKMVSEEELLKQVQRLAENGTEKITLSGGEPSLHPSFIPLIEACQAYGMRVFVLSNGERFAEIDFMEQMKRNIDMKCLHVITTMHSHNELVHEAANRTKGSFERSIRGIRELETSGCHVTLKHCITKDNYKELSAFYDYYDTLYPEQIDFQMCGIDYCGLDEKKRKDRKLSFVTMRPYLEMMFDRHIERQRKGSRRRLYCINIPLCACDIYYWNFLMKNHADYDGYLDPDHEGLRVPETNIVIDEKFCVQCRVKTLCPGTYKTVFSCFGGELIKPYL